MVYIGVLEQSRFLNSGFTEIIVLYLSGNSYNDLSPFQHPVTVNGTVPISNGSYIFPGNADSYFSIPYNDNFYIGEGSFSISFDVKLNTTSNHYVLSLTPNNTSRGLSIFLNSNSIRFNYVTSETGSTLNKSSVIPDSDFLDTHQTFKIEKINETFNFYYKNNLINQTSINDFFVHSVPLRIGRQTVAFSFLNASIKNILIKRLV